MNGIPDLDVDIMHDSKIMSKINNRKDYCQNLYAAMCNNEFQKIDMWQVLCDHRWSCSWRTAGGIIADFLGHGNYMDWYCSGSLGLFRCQDSDSYQYDQTWQNFVIEGTVTEEIAEDLRRIGWSVIPYEDSD